MEGTDSPTSHTGPGSVGSSDSSNSGTGSAGSDSARKAEFNQVKLHAHNQIVLSQVLVDEREQVMMQSGCSHGSLNCVLP